MATNIQYCLWFWYFQVNVKVVLGVYTRKAQLIQYRNTQFRKAGMMIYSLIHKAFKVTFQCLSWSGYSQSFTVCMYGYWMEPNAQKCTYSWGSGAPAFQAADKTPGTSWRKRVNQHNFLRSKILKPKWNIIQPIYPGYFQQKYF